ncbi:MAG: formyltransferase family protein [Pseudomonadota bacterium]
MSKNESLKITVLVDNESWILPYAEYLVEELNRKGFVASLVRDARDIQAGWVCFFLGCLHIVKPEYLSRNQHNLVVHESELPKGRGFAPMAWQILDGVNSIPICLLDASIGEPDAGDIWLQDVICLQGYELLPEWRELQGNKTIGLCLKFINDYDRIKPIKQKGSPSFYERRRPKDSELDIDSSLKSQFDLLRIVDNERYPAFFYLDGNKYHIYIEKVV